MLIVATDDYIDCVTPLYTPLWTKTKQIGYLNEVSLRRDTIVNLDNLITLENSCTVEYEFDFLGEDGEE